MTSDGDGNQYTKKRKANIPPKKKAYEKEKHLNFKQYSQSGSGRRKAVMKIVVVVMVLRMANRKHLQLLKSQLMPEGGEMAKWRRDGGGGGDVI